MGQAPVQKQKQTGEAVCSSEGGRKSGSQNGQSFSIDPTKSVLNLRCTKIVICQCAIADENNPIFIYEQGIILVLKRLKYWGKL